MTILFSAVIAVNFFSHPTPANFLSVDPPISVKQISGKVLLVKAKDGIIYASRLPFVEFDRDWSDQRRCCFVFFKKEHSASECRITIRYDVFKPKDSEIVVLVNCMGIESWMVKHVDS